MTRYTPVFLYIQKFGVKVINHRNTLSWCKPGCTATEVRGLKFRIWKEEGMYYPSSENKRALINFAVTKKADLRLFFSTYKQKGSFLIRQLIQEFSSPVDTQ